MKHSIDNDKSRLYKGSRNKEKRQNLKRKRILNGSIHYKYQWKYPSIIQACNMSLNNNDNKSNNSSFYNEWEIEIVEDSMEPVSKNTILKNFNLYLHIL